MPTVAIASRTSGNARSASSTWRTLLSVNSRLEPTGVLRRSEMNPSSASGTNSVPTSGGTVKLARSSAVAMASTDLRCASDQSRMRPYRRCMPSMPRSIVSISRPSQGTRRKRPSGGSRHTDESIGSSVNETNRLTSTATVTVTPNW